jgi:hypothetical protein
MQFVKSIIEQMRKVSEANSKRKMQLAMPNSSEGFQLL